jgi:hypothetical protein
MPRDAKPPRRRRSEPEPERQPEDRVYVDGVDVTEAGPSIDVLYPAEPERLRIVEDAWNADWIKRVRPRRRRPSPEPEGG